MEFSKNLKSLIKVCNELNAEPDTLLVQGLHRVERSLEKESADIYRPFVLELYNRFRDDIMNNKTNFKWIENSQKSMTIILGDGTDTPSTKTRLIISQFYKLALDQKAIAEKELENAPDELYKERRELIRSDAILLHTFRLFREVAPDADRPTLELIVNHLESELGITSAVIPNTTEPPFNGLMNGIMGMMKNTGMEVPPQSEMPSPAEFGNMFQTMLNDPSIKETMSNVGKLLAESNGDITKVMGPIMQDIQSGKFNNLVKGMEKNPPK